MESAVSTQVSGKARESLLVLSDVHLGSDLNVQALTTGFGRRSKKVDDDLVRLLEHYRRTPPTGARWRVVIAGDFIDFIGMAIPAGDVKLETELNEEEVEHGIGNAEDHAHLKWMRVLERHPEVFRALAGFIADGHAITIVHGNHDVELYWPKVQAGIRESLVGSALVAGAIAGTTRTPEELDAEIEFCPWFFYQQGVAYIEHGHQYDPLCATDSILAPLSPLDPRRIAQGFCEVFLRYVVRPTKGIREHGHEHTGIVDYVRMGMNLGLRGMLTLGLRFALGVIELIRVQRGFLTDAARQLKAENERRMTELAAKTRLGLDKLRELAALGVPPVTRSIYDILASVLLDRLAVALGACFTLAVLVPLAIHRHNAHLSGLPTLATAIGVVVSAWIASHIAMSARRKIDPAMHMSERAAKLVKLFPAAFVVMGHTHAPVRQPIGERGTYINLGSWDEDETTDTDTVPYEAARTHLVIHPAAEPEAEPVAVFYRWDSKDGPREF